ncbi:unnamed protein product [Prorocentrum cordatum]|uniref:MMS19 nucleotide excision repair protein n=1 Tax=Prorocentrum cordatum TaxID=2364126 RepID=A0ABN9YE05_9DINO|nr:unnamed protein product [Polarella glacialis]
MPSSQGRREALGAAMMSRIARLLCSEDPVVAGRAATAAFYLAQASPNAVLFRGAVLGATGGAEALDSALPRILLCLQASREKQLQVLGVLRMACSVQDSCSEAFYEVVSRALLDQAVPLELFGVRADGCQGRWRLACAAQHLLLQMSRSCAVCELLVEWSALRQVLSTVLLQGGPPDLASDARACALGTAWNIAVARRGTLRVRLADVALGLLLDLARADAASLPAGLEPSQAGAAALVRPLDCCARGRLVTALFHLAKCEEVAGRPEWLESSDALLTVVSALRGKDLVTGMRLLVDLVQAHTQQLAPKALPMVWGHVTREDIADSEEAEACFGMLCCLSCHASVCCQGGRLPWHEAPGALALATGRLLTGAVERPAARRALRELLCAAGNLCLVCGGERRRALGKQLVPLLVAGLLRQAPAGHRPLLEVSTACLRQLCTEHGGSALLAVGVWAALEGGSRLDDELLCHLDDELLGRVLLVADDALRVLQRAGMDREFQEGCDAAARVLAGASWAARLSPRCAWQRSTEGELRVLIQVSTSEASILTLTEEALWSEGGSLRHALAVDAAEASEPWLQAQALALSAVATFARKGRAQLAGLEPRRMQVLKGPLAGSLLQLAGRPASLKRPAIAQVLTAALTDLCGETDAGAGRGALGPLCGQVEKWRCGQDGG